MLFNEDSKHMDDEGPIGESFLFYTSCSIYAKIPRTKKPLANVL